MPLVQGEIKALPNLLEAAPAAEAADEAAVTDRATPAADAHPTEKAA